MRGDLNPAYVTNWLATHKGWNSTTKRNAITALQRGFNWAGQEPRPGPEPNPRYGEAGSQETCDHRYDGRV